MFRTPLALLMLLVAGCSGGGGGDGGNTPPPPPAKASLTVMNSTALPITAVHFSPASANQWGANQLTSSIAPGTSRTIANVTPGIYDVRAVANDGSLIDRSGVQLTEGGAFTWTVVSSTGSLRIVNGYTAPITQIYVSSSTANDWGANQLSAPIPAGGSFTLTNIPAGTYDLRAVASDGAYVEEYDVTIPTGAIFTWTLTTATQPTGSLTVVNNYSFPITELYVTASTSTSWGPNQLSAPIPVGGSFTLTGIPAGSLDMRAAASNGAFTERYDVPLAAGQTLTWTLTTVTEPTGSLRVVNNYSFPITELYVSPSTSSDWGPNQLTAPIPVGGSFTLTGIPAGSIDLRAVASNGAYTERYGVQLAAGESLTWTLTTVTQPTGSLTVFNNYSYPITELYVVPSTSSTWGPNQLSTPIPVGGSFTLTGIPAGTIDLRAVASDGAFVEEYGAILLEGQNLTWTLSAPASLTLYNSYYSPITEVYLALSSSTTWGPNRLSAQIPVGGSFTITGITPGTYDFNAYASGGYWERYGYSFAPGADIGWNLVP